MIKYLIIGGYLLIINLAAFCAMFIDKKKAEKKKFIEFYLY